MKVAVVGSRDLKVNNLGDFLPKNTTEIVSGGARGIDTCAKKYAEENNIPIKEFLPDYASLGRMAPLARNDLIIKYADCVIAFWDGYSHGTKYVIDNARKHGKPVRVLVPTKKQ